MEDTIAAIATPFGEGGIGIIRLSGDEAGRILNEVFVPAGKAGTDEAGSRKLMYGRVKDPDTGNVIDEVLAVFMKGPHTYTGEDVAEIDCHGGIVPLRRTLELVYSRGARPAERGEFTKRAYLNGRIDLSQAEAVIDLVKAKADRSFDVAMDQLQGKLSEDIRKIRAKLMDLLVELTVNIDYPDEDIEVITYERLDSGLKDVQADISRLIASSNTGRLISEGIKVSIIGKPNVGKSSLMNALLRESRAIVTDIPGTTRDTIQESLAIDGIPVVLTDTAGIRETEDKIETIGIERSKASFNEADLVLFMIDGSRELSAEDRLIAEHLDPQKTVCIVNKSDMEQKVTAEEIKALSGGAPAVETTLLDDSGAELVEKIIKDRVLAGETSQEESVTVTSARHEQLLRQAEQSVKDALVLVRKEEPVEIIEIDVNQAYESLGEIIGESVGDDIIDEVFSRFCLGK
ncbi:MAG: tRNA uridine-5-carboxymethylaminomethyl(34) synthesis GTPase MnmE [Eubacterium sp.]|nr:tRNA uridine-5-carboxymethylaminomethyl(34) synthesis GTPase MnmE [Eubacterium sp.]